MKTPVANTNDPAVERNISRSDMDIVIAVSDKIPELSAVHTMLSTLQVLEASVVDKASEVAANTLIVQSETSTTVSNAASALASKNAAGLSEINASNSANYATISKDNALASEVSANASAQSALNSKDSANLSAVSASASESVATTKASEASTSASEASVSATSASTSATTSTTQAGIATTKANEASVSASNALTSETNANDSEIMAHKWAQEAEDVEVAQGEYSAKHWATKAWNIVYGGLTATTVSYNNDSGLTATNIQDAIDELLAEIDTIQGTLVSDHTLLSNIGTNTHAQIDSAITRLANTSGTNTGDQIITLTGDVSGSGTDSFIVTLKDTGTAGTYKSVTTDAQGRVIAGTNPTTLSGYGITDVYTKAELNAGQLDNRYYTETEVNAALALKVDDTEIASVNLLRADKYLAAQNIAAMVYTAGDLTKIQYNNAMDVNYEVLNYISGNLTSINHYTTSVLRGTTTLSYSGGNLVSAIYVGV